MNHVHHAWGLLLAAGGVKTQNRVGRVVYSTIPRLWGGHMNTLGSIPCLTEVHVGKAAAQDMRSK
jgi:hypothetical protein